MKTPIAKFLIISLLILTCAGFTRVGPNSYTQIESGIYYKEASANGANYHILKISIYKEKVSLKAIVSKETAKKTPEGELIDMHNPAYNATGGPLLHKYEPLTVLAAENGVDAAVNAGFFNPTVTYGSFEETVVVDGQIINFRPDRAVFAWEGKTAKIGVYSSFDNLPFKQNAIGGGPVFVKDGLYNFDPYNESFSPQVKQERTERKNARTAIGLDERGKEMYILVVDGNDDIDVGMTAQEMADILINDYDVYTAMMLDGGGSSSLVIQDELVNMPNLGKDQRKILSGIGFISE